MYADTKYAKNNFLFLLSGIEIYLCFICLYQDLGYCEEYSCPVGNYKKVVVHHIFYVSIH